MRLNQLRLSWLFREFLKGLVTDKVRTLVSLVDEAQAQYPGQSMLVFVEMRVTAAALASLLSKCSDIGASLSPRCLVGGNPTGLLRQSAKTASRTLAAFSSGESKLLVATEASLVAHCSSGRKTIDGRSFAPL
jgi:ERCC4-related helicase